MKRSLFLLLLATAPAFAADEAFTSDDLRDPAQALMRSRAPAGTAGLLLEAGEDAAVADFAARLSDRHADVANKVLSQLELYRGNPAGALQALELIQKPDPWTTAQLKYVRDLVALRGEQAESR